MSMIFSSRQTRRWAVIALGVYLAVSVVAAAGADTAPAASEGRLRPSGLEGAVLLDTGARVSELAAFRFVRDAGTDGLTVMIVGEGTSAGLPDLLMAKDAKTVAVLKLADAAAASSPHVAEALKKSKGVWLVANGDATQVKEILNPIAQCLREVRLRGGVVAASKTAAFLLAARYLDANGATRDGLAILPGMLMGKETLATGNVRTLEAALAQVPGMVGVQPAESAVLYFKGRDIRALGPAKAELLLARSATREPRKIEITSTRSVDFNEMRRAALGRAQAALYPPKEVPVPEVPKGSLVIVGGGGMPADISKRFVELGGGEKGAFIVLPISNPDPLPANSGEGFLKRCGAKDIVVIKAREQKDLETPENLAALKRATGIWFGGGRQWRFVDAYEGTKIPELFRDVLRRGGVIGGSSAGATIQGDYLCRGAPGGPNNIICEGYEKALCFLPGVAIDQHFTQRNRFKDMVLLMKTYPQFLGIGLDEATAIVVQGHVAEVMGPNQVHIYDWRKPVQEGKPDHDSFKAGTRYDLKERRVLGAKEGK
jgi:cyanophycinase